MATDTQNAAEPVDRPVLGLVTQQFVDALAVAGASIHTLSPAEATRRTLAGRVGKPIHACTRTERSVSDAEGQVRLQTSAELARAFDAQAHEMIDAVAAAVVSAQAGLNWLRGESPDLEQVQQALNDIVNVSKRAAEIVVRLQALCVRTDCSGRGGG